MVLNNQAALAALLKMVVVRSNVVIVREGHLGAGDANIWDMNGEVVARARRSPSAWSPPNLTGRSSRRSTGSTEGKCRSSSWTRSRRPRAHTSSG